MLELHHAKLDGAEVLQGTPFAVRVYPIVAVDKIDHAIRPHARIVFMSGGSVAVYETYDEVVAAVEREDM